MLPLLCPVHYTSIPYKTHLLHVDQDLGYATGVQVTACLVQGLIRSGSDGSCWGPWFECVEEQITRYIFIGAYGGRNNLMCCVEGCG